MTCTAAIRPFLDDTEVRCESDEPGHGSHWGDLRDYAYPGSTTRIHWLRSDRRTFNGDWPGRCPGLVDSLEPDGSAPLCSLPTGHHGAHA